MPDLFNTEANSGSAANLAFEPFGFVLASSTAGFHDGQRLAIDLKSFTDPVVAYHEGVHQSIFIGTADGQVLSSLLQLLGLKREWGMTLPASVAPLAELLMNNSRLAHEAAATYLAIKRFSPGPGDKAYERLPAKYKEYFYTLADVVDERFDKKRVRCVMAEGIWHTVFDSHYQARLVDSGLEWAPDPRPEELPDERLKRLLDALRHSDMNELGETLDRMIEIIASKISEEPPQRSIESDNARAQKIFDLAVSQACVPLICGNLLELSSLPSLSKQMDHTAILHKYADMMRPYELTIKVADVSPRGQASAKALWQGRSLLTNERLLPCEREDDRILAGDEVFETIREFQVLSAEPPDHFKRWMFIGFRQYAPPSGGYFSADAVLNWLGRCRDREREGRSYPQARAITVAVRTLAEIQEFQETLMSQIGIADAPGHLRSRSAAVTTWYWRESWLQLLWLLSKMGSLRAMGVRMTKSEARELEAAVMIKVVNSNFIQGHVIRVLSMAAHEELRSEESRLLKEGKMSNMENDPNKRAASYAARNSFQLIQDYWSQF
jgi:hypothetical protein